MTNIKNWKEHHAILKKNILELHGQNNQPYLKVLQKQTINLESWITRVNINQYTLAYSSFPLHRFNQINIESYNFTFDWCDIENEILSSFRNEPKTFTSFISDLFYISDFLLSYSSLRSCPDVISGDLYYVQSKERKVFYECKLPPIIYDFNFKKIDAIEIDYCESKLLKELGLLRDST